MSERDFTPLMEGVRGGCRTVVANDRRDVTFTAPGGRLLLSISPEGVLKPGPALDRGRATQELIEILVESFGRAYCGDLRKAEDRTKEVEAENKRLKATVRFEKDRADSAERKLAEERARR